MANTVGSVSLHNEYPSRADLRRMMSERPVPVLAPGTVDSDSLRGEETSEQAKAILSTFDTALAEGDAETLESCFVPDQAYWKDVLALTYHLRTFYSPKVIAASLLETRELRGITGELRLESSQFVPASPTLQFIDVSFSFKTRSPAASCGGRLLLLPLRDGSETLNWKIWVLSTKLENLDLQPEDESLLQAPARRLIGLERFETDVFIIGGGNAAVALAARLKALNVESVMAERNGSVGDNWALRYDSLKLHVPTSFCELPYMTYDKQLQKPHLLTKDELAEQLRRFVATFSLNVLTSVQIRSTGYDQSAKRWTITFQTPRGQHTVFAKHLVQATGIGSQKPRLPDIADKELYRGINIHSAEFKNGKELGEKGVESVLIVGSANTAFDVLEDCYAAGLRVTMNVRSPTYIVPVDYVCDSLGLGAYDFGVEAADRLFLTLPAAVDGQLARNLFRQFASKEPGRYSSLAAAGFPVLDSTDPDQALFSNLIETAGGHYVDTGGTDLLAEGKAGIKALVEPVAYTETGLRFSDNSIVETDAVVWCTGFADRDARAVAADVLGGLHGEQVGGENLFGPQEIAALLDTTWGVDAEGEIRGMWKRHLRLDNYWVMGGYTQQHRWHSRTLALQIKAALEGILPPAYRETPVPEAAQ